MRRKSGQDKRHIFTLALLGSGPCVQVWNRLSQSLAFPHTLGKTALSYDLATPYILLEIKALHQMPLLYRPYAHHW
jgi:hypothetical protein